MGDPDSPKLLAQQRQLHACQRPDIPCAVCCDLPGLRIVKSEELLGGGRELLIVHNGQVYRLLRTRNDKLILQK